MENGRLIMKCCICGRVKSEHGWEYQLSDQKNTNLYSHGFCAVCYETEIRKIKMQAMLPQVILAR